MRLIECLTADMRQEIRKRFKKLIKEHNLKVRGISEQEEPPRKVQKVETSTEIPKEQIEFFKEMQAKAMELFEGSRCQTSQELSRMFVDMSQCVDQ